MVDFDLYVDIECYSPLLCPDGLIINDPDDDPINVLGGWVDATEDIRTIPSITYSRGNPNNDIEARVADEGVLTLGFDNSIGNSAGLAGYYSPDRANCRDCFGQNMPIRIRYVYDSVTYYDWQGTIATIQPSAGEKGERITIVEAVDYMRYFYDTDFEGVSVQLNKRDDELITTLLTLLPVQPEATDFDTGNDQYTYAYHDDIDGASSVVSVLQKMMMSGLGKFFVVGGTSTAETLKYINRQNILDPGSAVAALDNNMVGLDVIRDGSSLIKKINITSFPVEIDSTDVVLWQLNSEITLTPGVPKTFKMYLRDPNGRATKVSALSLVDPVADTDFKFSSVSGSGNDLNADLDIVYSDGTSSIDVTVTNNAAVPGYLWFFKPRGKGIYLYEPTTISESTGQTYGETLNITMYYQEDVNVARDIATIMATWYADAKSNITAVKFIANSSDALMEAAMVVQPGDYVTIKENQTGINTGFIVNGVSTEIASGNILYKTWYLCQAQIVQGFILDVDLLDVGVLGV